MSPTLEQQLVSLADKVQQLLKQQHRLKKENERLQQELLLCRRGEETYQQQITELEQRIAILRYAAGELPEKEKKDFEKTINGYIRELDKVIAFLSR